jgi:phytol kinase
MISNPWLAMGVTLILCLMWMRAINLLTDKNIIKRTLSRKIIHIGTGPVFVLCWLLFPDEPMSKYLAAVVPFLIVLQITLVGSGIMKDRTSVLAMARTGEKTELLKGPFLYGVIFVVITILFWKSIHAVIALMLLCGGDGVADLIGSRVKSPKLPWTKSKTIIGSTAMFVGGFVLALTIIVLVKNYFPIVSDYRSIFPSLILISIIATVIESITPSDFDNLTVPISSLIMSLILF